MKRTLESKAHALMQRAGRAHGFYFLTALAAGAATSAAFEGPARLVPLAVAWWIAAVHELGHALPALVLGMQVQACLAVPGFGRTRIRHGRRHVPFAVIALAGPVAGIAAALSVAAYATSSAFGTALGEAGRGWLVALGWLGALESALNLLPVHPRLDGSAALRAIRITRSERAAVRALRPRWVQEHGASAALVRPAGATPRAPAAIPGCPSRPRGEPLRLPALGYRLARPAPLVPRAFVILSRRDRRTCVPRQATLRPVA